MRLLGMADKEKKSIKYIWSFPKKEQRKKKLVELAEKKCPNGSEKDKERIKREEGRTIGAVKELQNLFGLNRTASYGGV